MRVLRIEPQERPIWADPIRSLEGSARYPLGDDTFRIDHGADYFRFFDRMGELAYYVAVQDGAVVAVGAGVLRTLPIGALGRVPAWYLCDLKVRPDWRGRHLPLQMLATVFPNEYPRSPRGYGISMNPPSGRNRILGIYQRFPLVPVQHVATLELYSLDASAMQAALPVVRAHRGETSFLSLRGIKDIILSSTGAPMALWHVQHGPLGSPGPTEVDPAGLHMLCTPAADPLSRALHALGHAPTATATVIARGMEGFDWANILTSEI